MNAVAPAPEFPSLQIIGKTLFFLGLAAVLGGELLTWRVSPQAAGMIVWILGILLEVGSALAGILDYLNRGGPKDGGVPVQPEPEGFPGASRFEQLDARGVGTREVVRETEPA